ncbi:MAG: MBL fold metallo-hydrolase [Gemmatimonadetes bacterium]|nr:MBL fold metallo-hydrolase [Gemmatimonadota bacterium]
MSPETLRQMLDRGEAVTVLDVRRAADWREWSIPGSIHLDVHDALWANDAGALRDFVPLKNGRIVTVCGRGQTSLLAATRLRQRGIEALSLQGGMRAWSLAWNWAPVAVPGTPAAVVQVRRTGKGCLSYLVGSQGRAAVIDPSVEPRVYLDLAAARRWKITDVIDTHVHADHLSRARQLAELAGATVYLPAQQRVTFPFTPLNSGDKLSVGDATLEVLSTPGHTFESACYLLDGKALFTGDTLFLSSVGRPDLAAKADEETRQRARLLYGSLQRLKALPPETVVLPCHTSEPIAFDGRALAGTLQEVCARTEQMRQTENEFVEAILARIPPPPANHLKIVELNEQGTLPADTSDLEAGANRCAVG